MIERKHVVIARKWDNPTINIGISADAIAIDMTLDAFLSAVAEEYGNPASTLTKPQHLARLRAAAESVTTDMKHETSKVM